MLACLLGGAYEVARNTKLLTRLTPPVRWMAAANVMRTETQRMLDHRGKRDSENDEHAVHVEYGERGPAQVQYSAIWKSDAVFGIRNDVILSRPSWYRNGVAPTPVFPE